MTIQDLFQETCTIEEVVRTPDGSGGVGETWADYITDLKCRFQAMSGREQAEYMKLEVKAGFKLFCLPQSKNIKEGQHRVKFSDGVEDRIFDIVFVDKWNFDEHHWKLLLEERK